VACCLLLVAEDDDRKFLTTMGALGGTVAVSLACMHPRERNDAVEVSRADEVAYRLLLVIEDGDRKLLTTMGALGSTVAVSLACTRASATTRSRLIGKTRWPATDALGQGRHASE
jgi:hypothetical protein